MYLRKNKKKMQILDRVSSNINLCGIELAFNADVAPSIINGWQPFYNTTFKNSDFTPAYANGVSIKFGEESVRSVAGISYTQIVSFRFPNSDKNRAERISLLQKIKYIKLKQTNGLDLVIGRNDFYQNTNPVVKIKNEEQLCVVEVESQSIFPSGYTPSFTTYGLPVMIPVTLL